MKKFVVTEAANGLIVRVHNHGKSILMEPYEKSLLVFRTHLEFADWLNKFLTPENKNAAK